MHKIKTVKLVWAALITSLFGLTASTPNCAADSSIYLVPGMYSTQSSFNSSLPTVPNPATTPVTAPQPAPPPAVEAPIVAPPENVIPEIISSCPLYPSWIPGGDQGLLTTTVSTTCELIDGSWCQPMFGGLLPALCFVEKSDCVAEAREHLFHIAVHELEGQARRLCSEDLALFCPNIGLGEGDNPFFMEAEINMLFVDPNTGEALEIIETPNCQVNPDKVTLELTAWAQAMCFIVPERGEVDEIEVDEEVEDGPPVIDGDGDLGIA